MRQLPPAAAARVRLLCACLTFALLHAPLLPAVSAQSRRPSGAAAKAEARADVPAVKGGEGRARPPR